MRIKIRAENVSATDQAIASFEQWDRRDDRIGGYEARSERNQARDMARDALGIPGATDAQLGRAIKQYRGSRDWWLSGGSAEGSNGFIFDFLAGFFS